MVQPFYKLKVSSLSRETKEAISIRLEVPDQLKDLFEFKAGQYLTIAKEVGGNTLRRAYSISAAPHENELKITSKRVKGGKLSTYFLHELAVGEELDVKPPQGSFTLRDVNKELVLFAGGSGISPIISILKAFLKESALKAYLFYGNTSREEVIFWDELNELKEQYQGRVLVQHYLSGDGERLDQLRVKSLVENQISDKADYYVCGPKGMMKAVLAALEDQAFKGARVFTEYFNNPEAEESANETIQVNMSQEINKVVVRLDDQDHQIELQEGESILEGAERIGIDPPFSCHSGVCTTCKAKLISGKVRMENNFGLGQDEEDEGFVLTCIGYPEAAGTKIDWDQG